MPFFRFMFGLPMAALITVGLFMAMSGMIAQKEIQVTPTVTTNIDILAKITDTDPTPQPPRTKVPDAPDPIEIGRPAKTGPPDGGIEFGGLDPVSVNPGPIGGPTLGRPTLKTAPAFPENCRAKGAQGVVIVEFDVTADGAVVNARIVSSPDRCFNRTAIRAISGWKYTPAVRDGRAVPQRGLREVISFQLED